MMQLLTSLDALRTLHQPVHWAMGFFDGVHVGHQRVMCTTATTGALRGVLTFDRHPLALLRPQAQPQLLTPDAAYKADLIARTGADVLLRLPFTPELAGMEPEAFLDALAAACGIAGISVGANWRFGRGGSGSAAMLQHEGMQRGFPVSVCDLAMLGMQPVSSTRIRRALSAGALEEVGALLGRPYAISGVVEPGQRLARKLGFPTANISGLEQAALPPFGVYQVRCCVGESTLTGIANLGLRPTIAEQKKIPRLEVHFPDWQGDLYGEHLVVELRRFLRPEVPFSGIEALQAQIRRDIASAFPGKIA